MVVLAIVMESMRGERGHGWGTRKRREAEDGIDNRGVVRNGRAEQGQRQRLIVTRYSALNRAPPPPPRMIARIKARKRSAYSAGGTGLILCYIRHARANELVRRARQEKGRGGWRRTLSADMPFHKCSTLFTTPYGVKMSMMPR